MAEIVLVTGGSRSGKSRHAQELAVGLEGRKIFVATCPVVDAEMEERIRRHKDEREGKGWETIEESVDLDGVLRRVEGGVLLVDCLTLWINNLMYEAEKREQEIGEDEVEQRCRRLLEACASRKGTVIFVTNEVGMGIVPENSLARLYRDLVGRCNQVVAAGADQVIFMVSGLPLKLKQGGGSGIT